MAKSSRVFVFFNCDENKSIPSMNIFYNHAVYKDTKTSRKALLKKIKEENMADRVEIKTADIKEVEFLVTEGDPVEASQFIKFGAVKTLDCF